MPASVTPLRFRRLLLTGAAGHLGRELRARLRSYCDTLRLSHRSAMGEPGAGEEIVLADLADAQAFLKGRGADLSNARPEQIEAYSRP